MPESAGNIIPQFTCIRLRVCTCKRAACVIVSAGVLHVRLNLSLSNKLNQPFWALFPL